MTITTSFCRYQYNLCFPSRPPRFLAIPSTPRKLPLPYHRRRKAPHPRLCPRPSRPHQTYHLRRLRGVKLAFFSAGTTIAFAELLAFHRNLLSHCWPPPDPPPSTHPPASDDTHKHHRHRRHDQQHLQPPEEPPSPARSGRASGSAPPTTRSHSPEHESGSAPSPVANGEVPEVAQAMEVAMNDSVQPWSLSRSGGPPLPAGNAVASRVSQAAGTAYSSDLGANERWDSVEGTSDVVLMRPGSANPSLPANVSYRNLTGFLPESARQVFGGFPERAPRGTSGGNVQTVAGEVWERGPESILGAVFQAPSTDTPLRQSPLPASCSHMGNIGGKYWLCSSGDTTHCSLWREEGTLYANTA